MSERHPFEDEFKRRVIAARRSSHLTLRDLEAKSGVPFNTISRVERGKGISFGNALRLAETLNIPLTHQRRPQMTTVYVSIGNSDDKLTQARWAQFLWNFRDCMGRAATQVYGEWLSAPDSSYQNACVAIATETPLTLKAALAALAHEYGQDSIAWAEAPETEFIAAVDPE